MQKIQNISFWFKLLFQFAFILLPCLLVVFWLDAPRPIGFPGFTFLPDVFVSQDIIFPASRVLSGETKWLGFLISFIPYGIVELILYFLIRLFNLYAKGEIFSLNVVTYWKKLGMTILIGQFLNPVYMALITATLSWGNGHGHRFIAISFTSVNVGIFLMAFMIILISWIMAEGYRLREEQLLTV